MSGFRTRPAAVYESDTGQVLIAPAEAAPFVPILPTGVVFHAPVGFDGSEVLRRLEEAEARLEALEAK